MYYPLKIKLIDMVGRSNMRGLYVLLESFVESVPIIQILTLSKNHYINLLIKNLCL